MSKDSKSEFVNVIVVMLSTQPEEVAQDVSAVESDEGARWFLENKQMTAPQLHLLKILSEKIKEEGFEKNLFDNFSASRSEKPNTEVFLVTSQRPEDVIRLIEASELSSRVVELFSEPFRPEDLPVSMRPKPATLEGTT